MIFLLGDLIEFPNVEYAEENGLLAVGGDLSPERIISAYKNGIFPWYSKDEPILWWSPNPRFVLFPEKIHISTSMKKILKKEVFNVTYNKCFDRVIRECMETRKFSGTWLNEDMIKTYVELYKKGYGVSVETWQNNELVGGLYGVIIGKVFYGESMFSKVSNASKVAFIKFVREELKKRDIKIIDCQVYSKYLESFGAEFISRKEFISFLKKYC